MSEDTPRGADDVPSTARSPGPPPGPGWAPPSPTGWGPPEPGATAAAHTAPTPVGRWWSRSAAGLPVGAWMAMGVVAIAAIVTAAVMLGGDDRRPTLAIDVTELSIPPGPETAPETTPTPTTVAPDRPTPDSSAGRAPGSGTNAATDTAAPQAPGTGPTGPPDSTRGSRPPRPAIGDGTEPTGPLPVGDPDVSTFQYADGFGSEWTGSIGGVVEVPPLWEDEAAAIRCFAVIGTLTPTAFGGVVSDSWSTPYLTLFVGGDEAELSNAVCATDELAARGYRSMFEANVTLGTEFAFFTEFSLPESAGDPQAIAVSQGSPAQGDPEWVFFDATLLDAAAPATLGAVGPLAVEATPIGDGAPGAFTHIDDYTGDAWSGSILGLVEVPTDPAAQQPGRCFAVIGTLTADAAGAGALTSPYSAPSVALIADGRLVADYYGCSTSAAESAGYRWFNDAEITPGTTIAVYAALMVPQPLPGQLQAIVVGDPWVAAPAVLAPHELGDFAPVSVTPGPPPGGDLAPPGTPFSVAREADDDVIWDALVHGYVPTAPGAGECVVVYASFTLTAGSAEPSPPEVFLIAGGRLLAEDFECDTDAARAAGYVEQWSQVGRIGQSVHVYAGFRVAAELGPPQAVVVGRSGVGEQTVVAPAELDAIPPIPG